MQRMMQRCDFAKLFLPLEKWCELGEQRRLVMTVMEMQHHESARERVTCPLLASEVWPLRRGRVGLTGSTMLDRPVTL